jgi:hypothetical protein
MATFKPLEAARFLRHGAALGVVDVKEFEGRIFVFVESDLDLEKKDAIRLLASLEWPAREILIAERRSIHTTCVQLIGPDQQNEGGKSDESPSPPPGKASGS